MRTHGFDLLVVGAGSAGAALAARSARKGKRVLLLEAGPDFRSAELPEVWRLPNPLRALADPAAGAHLLHQGLLARRTQAQEPGPYLQGRGVGGCSTVNGQIAIRPPMADFADWSAAGCAGWAPEDVLPYFARLEDDAEFGDAPGHGRGGPIPIHRTPRERWGAVDAALCAAALDAGFGWAPDVNAPGAAGVSPYPINSRAGRRVSTADGYLEPARGLATLTVLGGATVDRVLFAGGSGGSGVPARAGRAGRSARRAVGVRYVRDGAPAEAFADRVVLSAGAVHSPAVLQRSGFGPAGRLRALGVEVAEDLPVGQGLQDHPLSILGLPLTAEAAAAQTTGTRTCASGTTATAPAASRST